MSTQYWAMVCAAAFIFAAATIRKVRSWERSNDDRTPGHTTRQERKMRPDPPDPTDPKYRHRG